MKSDTYHLGTSQEELERLGYQHQVWLDVAVDLWREAGFKHGVGYVLGAMNIVDFDTIPHALLSLFEEEGRITDRHEVITHYVTHYQILEHLAEIASILFFLIGAMTIVELIDAHEGFSVITDKEPIRSL